MTDLPETVPEFQQTVDAVGLACPLPILRAKKHWRRLQAARSCA